jgi:hypothetical protein
MPETDHKFKRVLIENDVTEEDKKKEEEQKVKEFAWEDDLEEDEDNGGEFDCKISELNECVSCLAVYLMDTISFPHMHSDDESVKFSVPVELSLHPLLISRFLDEWSLVSRLEIFGLIRSQFIGHFASPYNQLALNTKIHEIFPPTERKTLIFDSIELLDDAMAVQGEVNTISIEIRTKFQQA